MNPRIPPPEGPRPSDVAADGPRIPGTNTGHGHVWKRPDRMVARCGGPARCAKCKEDAAEAQDTAAPPSGPAVKQPRIVEFLRARYAEEQRAAESATGGVWVGDLDGIEATFSLGSTTVIRAEAALGGAGNLVVSTADEAHIIRWQPTRVLADLAAKRAVLDLYEGNERIQQEAGERIGAQTHIRRDLDIYYRLHIEMGALQACVEALLQPYASHPEFIWGVEATT